MDELRKENSNLQTEFYSLQKENLEIKKIHDEKVELLYLKLNELEFQQKSQNRLLELKDVEICNLSNKIESALKEVQYSSELLKEEQEGRVILTELFNDLQCKHEFNEKASIESNKHLSNEINQLRIKNKKLQSELEALKIKIQKLDKKLTKINKLKEELYELKKENGNLKYDVSNKATQIEFKEKQISEIKNRYVQLKDKHSNLLK